MRGSRLCCGLHKVSAARRVAYIDILVGATFFLILFGQLKRACYKCEDGSICCQLNEFFAFNIHTDDAAIMPGWIPLLYILICTSHIILGVILLIACATTSRYMCRVYVCSTAVISPFCGILPCVYQILVVLDLAQELEIGIRPYVSNNANSCDLNMTTSEVHQPSVQSTDPEKTYSIVPENERFDKSGTQGFNDQSSTIAMLTCYSMLR